MTDEFSKKDFIGATDLQEQGQAPYDEDEPFPAIRRRCVFFVGGYDPQSAHGFFARLAREMRHFENTWQVGTSILRTPSGMTEVGRATIVASQDDFWRVETDFHFLSLDSLVLEDFARPLPVRLARYACAFADYVLTGAAFRIAAQSWRFGLYFLYPFAMAVAVVAAALLAGAALTGLTGTDGAGVTVAMSLVLMLPLFILLARRTPVVHLMDLWSFSRDFLRGKRPDAEALLSRFATHVVETASDSHDEILLVGHSTGGGLILDIAARALDAGPDLAAGSPRISLLTLGSTALKFGLHPAARDFRRKVKRLVEEPRLQWTEYQCMTDPINFYRVDPVAAMKLDASGTAKLRTRPFPVMRQVHMRDALELTTYKRIRRNFLRVHYQFVMGNTRRYFYDFHMICFGPLSLLASARLLKADPRLM